MKLITKFLIVILSFFLLCPSTNVYAEPRYETYYGIDISSISDLTTKEYVSSLYLKQEGDAYRLIVNNVSVGSVTSTGTLSYSPNAYVTIRFNIDIPNRKITFNSTKLKVESIDAVLDFSATNFNDPEYQELTIRPNKESGTSVTLKAKLNDNGWFYFDNYTYNYNGIGKDFKISLNSSDGSVYNNGTSVGKLNGDNTVTVKLWYEDDIGEDDYLDLDYLGKLTPYSLSTAKKAGLYSQSEIENALKSYTGDRGKTMHNNVTKDTVNFNLTMYIYTRPRLNPGAAIGDGIYGDEDGGKIQVICQWSDDACASVRTKFGGDPGRLFAVIDKTRAYRQISKTTGMGKTKRGDIITEASTTFPSIPKEVKESINTNPRIEYAKREKTWGAYGTETTYYIDSCSSNANCEYKTRAEYKDYLYGSTASGYTEGCTYKWYEHNYSCGLYNKTCPTSACGCASYKSCENSACGYKSCAASACGCASYKSCKTSGCGYASCAASGCGCASYKSCQNGSACGYTYSCKTSGGQYSSGTNKCPSGYPILVSKKAKTCQASACGCSYYQTCKNSACGYKECQNSSCGCSYYQSCKTSACGYAKCQNINCGCSYYQTCNHQDCGTEYGSCNLHYCPQSRTLYYQYRYKDWGGWTDFIGTTTSPFANTSEIEYRYRLRYTGEKTEVITYYLVTSKIIGTMPMMTDSQIQVKAKEFNEAYATENTIRIAKEYFNEGVSEEYKLRTSDFDSWKNGAGAAKYNAYLNSSLADGNKFLNDANFVPYIYIRAHVRATSKDTTVKAFNSSSSYNWEARYSENPSPDGPHPLEEYEEPASRDSKVIYYDYKEPLTNYGSVVPSELEGLEAVINALKNSDLEQEKISVKISKDDIDNMKKWLNDNHYVTGKDSCELLKTFAYIFDDTTKSRILSQSCSIH